MKKFAIGGAILTIIGAVAALIVSSWKKVV